MWFEIVILIVNILILVSNCLILGLKLNKAEPNPIKAHKQAKKDEQKQRKMDILWENIENYDGSNFGQKEIK